MIKASRFLLLAFSIPGSLQTSTLSSSHPGTGAKMSIFEKIDMVRHRRDINLCKPVSHQDATGYSGVEPEATEVVPSAFFADNSGEDSTPGKPEAIAKPFGRGAARESATSEDKEM